MPEPKMAANRSLRLSSHGDLEAPLLLRFFTLDL
jgi:hypothetical protein